MKTRKTFLKEISLVFVGLTITSSKIFSQKLSQLSKEKTAMPYELPPLAYPYNALEPFIDAQTMEIHYSKHHAAYVNNLNTALANYPDIQKKTPVELITFLNSIPETIRTAVRNNAGGHVNHTMFWQQLKKGVAEPKGKLGEAITTTFGSLDAMKEQFTKAGLGRFGSGWSWLTVDANKKLFITSTPNQDNPLMDGNIPILGCDVWEHAYYLKYQNKRADYLAAFWNVINWNDVAERYSTAVK